MRIIQKLGVVMCCVATFIGALVYAQGQIPRVKINNECTAWVANCLRDFETVKVGMTRGEIENTLPMASGLQGVSLVHFAHPTCPWFKIDVEFDFKRNAADQNRAIEGKNDKAIKVSKPYIEQPFPD